MVIGKQGMIGSKLSTLRKYCSNIIVTHYGSIINPHEQIYQSIEMLMVQDMRSIRWKGVDSIVVMADSLSYQ